MRRRRRHERPRHAGALAPAPRASCSPACGRSRASSTRRAPPRRTGERSTYTRGVRRAREFHGTYCGQSSHSTPRSATLLLYDGARFAPGSSSRTSGRATPLPRPRAVLRARRRARRGRLRARRRGRHIVGGRALGASTPSPSATGQGRRGDRGPSGPTRGGCARRRGARPGRRLHPLATFAIRKRALFPV